MSHGRANGFYFQDTMLLQFLGVTGGEKKRAATYDQHMGMS